MLSLLRDGPERAIAGARGPIKHAHSDLKRDHSFVASAARLKKDVLLDMAWELKEDFDFVYAMAGRSKRARQIVQTIREQISRHGRSPLGDQTHVQELN